MITTPTAVKGYVRRVNGIDQYVEAHTRTQGHGFTRDGQRKNRAQLEFLMVLRRRARKGDLNAQTRLTKMGETY